jgi:hypothetical protein
MLSATLSGTVYSGLSGASPGHIPPLLDTLSVEGPHQKAVANDRLPLF